MYNRLEQHQKPLTISVDEAFAEIQFLCNLYDLETLLLGACQIRCGHTNVNSLTAKQKIEVVRDVRPAIAETERYLETRAELERPI